jgi:tetratricopeptide (TPR) repeat protein
MTSEEPRAAGDEEDSPPGQAGHAADDGREEASPARKEAPARGDLSAETDPILVEDESVGFLSRLNPRNWFRRRNVEGFIREAKDLMDHGSYAQAIVAFQKVLEMDGNSVAALRGLGKVYYKRGGRSNMETALKHYQEAIKRRPMDHDLYAITAKIYDALGKRKEATLERKKFVIVRALDADARNPIANNNMGILFLQQGRADMALSYFRRAIESDRNYDVAYRNLAAVYFQLAKVEEDAGKKADFNSQAKEAIQKAMEIVPNPATLLAWGRIQLREGAFDEVVRICDRIDEMDPANKDVFYLKKLALEGLGRFEEAKDAHESYMMFLKGSGEDVKPEA